MAFKLGDVIIDRLQFGYGALADKALYALTQLQNATIDITADSTDVRIRMETLSTESILARLVKSQPLMLFLTLLSQRLFLQLMQKLQQQKRQLLCQFLRL